MTGVVTAYQPHYYPRLHYLARAQQADVFVIYDDVQFSRGSSQNSAPIEYQGMESLVAPVKHTGRDTSIDGAVLDMTEPWPTRHLETLVGKYGSVAEELTPFYERLCASILDIEFLRTQVDEVVALIDDRRGEELVEECLQRDAEWRTQKRELDDLRREKKRIRDCVAERKREDPTADIEDLVTEAGVLDKRLSGSETACQTLKEQRNRSLVELSDLLDEDDPVQWLSMHELWMVTGMEPEELMNETMLVELTVPTLRELLDRFGVTSTVVRSSELDVEHPGDPSEYLARLTAHFGGDSYLSGKVGYDNYLDEKPFDERGLDVIVQDWTPTWEDGNVCALDVLFNAEKPGRYIR